MIATLTAVFGKYLVAFFAVLFSALGLSVVISAKRAKSEANRAQRAETELKVKNIEVENANKPINELVKEFDDQLDADKSKRDSQ